MRKHLVILALCAFIISSAGPVLAKPFYSNDKIFHPDATMRNDRMRHTELRQHMGQPVNIRHNQERYDFERQVEKQHNDIRNDIFQRGEEQRQMFAN